MPTDDAFSYGPPSRDEAVTFLHLDGMAFGDDPGPNIKRLDEIGPERIRVLRHHGQVAAGLLVIDDGQWFGGRAVWSWGIAAVAVWPHHRRRGVGRRLMTEMLSEARAAGTPLSALYASTPTFYRNLGYEPAGWLMNWTVDPESFPRGGEAATLEPIDQLGPGAAGRRRVEAVYETAARPANGPMTRQGGLLWRWFVLEPTDRPRLTYLISFDGHDEGYVILDKQRDPRDDGGLSADIAVTTPRAAAAAGQLLYGLNSVVPRVAWFGGMHDPLRRLIPENAARWGRRSEEWLLRIVDVEAALAQRGYPPVHAELHLNVRDPLFADNAGRYVLSIRGGAATVQRGGSGRIDLDIRALAAVYTSHATPSEMQATGLLDGPAEDLAAMGLAFSGPGSHMVDKF